MNEAEKINQKKNEPDDRNERYERKGGDIDNEDERINKEQWKKEIISGSGPKFPDGKDRSWQSIHDRMMDEYQKSKEYPGNLSEQRLKFKQEGHIDNAKKMHRILKSHENQLVRDGKIRESELKAGVHHARLSWFAGILKGKRVVNFGPKDGYREVVPLELEKEEIRMAKHGEARKRYRHDMEVEEQLRRRHRLLRDDQARANRQAAEAAARQAADEEARPEHYPKGGKKRKRKTRRKIKHKKRKTRRRKTRKHKKKHRKIKRKTKHKKHKRKRKTKRR